MVLLFSTIKKKLCGTTMLMKKKIPQVRSELISCYQGILFSVERVLGHGKRDNGDEEKVFSLK